MMDIGGDTTTKETEKKTLYCNTRQLIEFYIIKKERILCYHRVIEFILLDFRSVGIL